MRKHFTFRFDVDLIDKVRVIAAKENRTLTNQIETGLFKLVEDHEDNKSKPGNPDKQVDKGGSDLPV